MIIKVMIMMMMMPREVCVEVLNDDDPDDHEF